MHKCGVHLALAHICLLFLSFPGEKHHISHLKSPDCADVLQAAIFTVPVTGNNRGKLCFDASFLTHISPTLRHRRIFLRTPNTSLLSVPSPHLDFQHLEARSPHKPLTLPQSEFRNIAFHFSAPQPWNNLQEWINLQLFYIHKFKMNGLRMGPLMEQSICR